MGDMSTLCLLRHAIDVTTDVAVTESSQRTIFQAAIVGKKFRAWLTVVAGCNRHLGLSDIASASRKALTRLRKVKKKSRRCRRLKGLQGGVKQSGQEPLSVQKAGHAPVMIAKA